MSCHVTSCHTCPAYHYMSCQVPWAVHASSQHSSVFCYRSINHPHHRTVLSSFFLPSFPHTSLSDHRPPSLWWLLSPNDHVPQYPFALLYFTGPDHFNRAIRNHASHLGFSLSDKVRAQTDTRTYICTRTSIRTPSYINALYTVVPAMMYLTIHTVRAGDPECMKRV